MEATARRQQISPLPSDCRNEWSLRLAAKVSNDTYEGIKKLQMASGNERNSLIDQQNDHGENSSVQTFSDIVSKQNQIQSKL